MVPLVAHHHTLTHPPNDVFNFWGSTLTGISFPSVVNVDGAYFSAQGAAVPTPGVRVRGYLNGVEVVTTGWFNGIVSTPQWFAMNLDGVDRIVVESVPNQSGSGGWFGMDNFTYTVVPEPQVCVLIIPGLLGLAGVRRRLLSFLRCCGSPASPSHPFGGIPSRL